MVDAFQQGAFQPGAFQMVSIGDTPGSYAFGSVSEGQTYPTGLDYFTASNNSGFNIDITISGTDMTGGTTWTLADDGNAGVNTIGIKAGLDGGDYTIIVRKTAPYNTLKAALAAGATQKFGIKLYAPTGITDPTAKSGVITLTASAS
jgi:hypothetical protein